MGLNECELMASTSPLGVDDTKLPHANCARELLSVCLFFFNYFLAKFEGVKLLFLQYFSEIFSTQTCIVEKSFKRSGYFSSVSV